MLMSARLVCVVSVCVVVVTFLVGRDFAAAQRSLPDAVQAGVKSGVYEVLAQGAVHHDLPGSQVLVRDEQSPIPAMSASAVPEWLRQFDAVPAELRDALGRLKASKPSPVDRSLFPAGTRFISQAAITAAFDQSLDGGWRSFRRRYNSGGWVSFSDVLVTADGLDALVYTEAHCGDLCGQGSYIWLRRTGPEAPWSIVKTIVRWIS
jgi:hypothetical protein